jgi:hypothetical protein
MTSVELTDSWIKPIQIEEIQQEVNNDPELKLMLQWKQKIKDLHGLKFHT